MSRRDAPRYRPITSHRQAFQKLARSLNTKDKRCYLLTGSYGTGKSHLCLMFANDMQTRAGEQPMPKFFENYSAVDPDAAEDLKTRRLKGKYLVALCAWGGKGDFEDVVLRAVDTALRREGFGAELDIPTWLRCVNWTNGRSSPLTATRAGAFTARLSVSWRSRRVA